MDALGRSRRDFLRGCGNTQRPVIRPPWAREEALFTDGCSRCDACIRSCPEGILIRADGGYPAVDFRRGECTLCHACVDACPQPVFQPPSAAPPWRHVAAVGDDCLGRQGVYCRSCGESCETGAIAFPLAAGRLPVPAIATDACTGCGACVAACPADAIRMVAPTAEATA